jgi:hypothetical protein
LFVVVYNGFDLVVANYPIDAKFGIMVMIRVDAIDDKDIVVVFGSFCLNGQSYYFQSLLLYLLESGQKIVFAVVAQFSHHDRDSSLI